VKPEPKFEKFSKFDLYSKNKLRLFILIGVGFIFVKFASPYVFNLPEILTRNSIIENEMPILGKKDFSGYKNLMPELSGTGIGLNIKEKNGYQFLIYQQKISMKDSFLPEFLHDIGGKRYTKYTRNDVVRHFYDIHILYKNVNSFQSCIDEANEKASRIEKNIKFNYKTSSKFVMKDKNTLILKTKGYFEKNSIKIGFKCYSKKMVFMFAYEEPKFQLHENYKLSFDNP
jgi:hypothetical protein